MAERKRRGKDAVDDRLDEAFDDETAADDDIDIDDVADLDEDLDEEDFDEDLDEDLDDDVDDDEPVRRRGNGRATLTKTGKKASDRPGTKGRSTKPGDKRATKTKVGDRRPNIFGRFINFFREVVAELRKVIWPTRKELLTYTLVVVVFLTLMTTVVFGLDWVFAKGVLTVFGNKPTGK